MYHDYEKSKRLESTNVLDVDYCQSMKPFNYQK